MAAAASVRSLVRGWRSNADGPSARLFGRGGICTACRKSLQRQAYSVAAAPLEQTSSHDVAPVLETSAPRPAWRVRAGLLLARAPQLTRDLTSFEKAYYLYQRRLNERLALPFGRYFYFKKDTPGALEWKRKVKDRRTAARDIGRYDAYSDESWNDEVLVGAKESETQHQAEALLRDSEITSAASSELAERRKDEVEPLQPRLTEADRQQDVGSLNRRLDRTLYLLGREAQGRWGFPAADLIRRESLNQVRRVTSWSSIERGGRVDRSSTDDRPRLRNGFSCKLPGPT